MLRPALPYRSSQRYGAIVALGPLFAVDLGRHFCARMKELRKRLQISQEELASLAGLHWTYLSDLERGRQTPTLDLPNRLARGFGVTLAEFFTRLDQPYHIRFRKRRLDRFRRSQEALSFS